MAILKFNLEDLLKASIKFEQLVSQAQGTYQYDPDKMKKDLDATIGRKVSDIASKYLQGRAISSVQINIDYKSPTATAFVVDSTGSDKQKVDAEMSTELNRLAPVAARIMGKYQKEPLNYRYLQF